MSVIKELYIFLKLITYSIIGLYLIYKSTEQEAFLNIDSTIYLIGGMIFILLIKTDDDMKK